MVASMLKCALRACLPARWVLYRVPNREGMAALTFDDGPNPEFTARISAVLRQAGVRATFFLVGERAQRFPALVDQLLADGHELGNHSMHHAEFAELSYAEIAAEVERPRLLAGAAGRPWLQQALFRPPKGVLNLKVLFHCIRTRHRIVLWNSDPKDYCASSVDAVLAHFDRRPVRPGDIVLLHDKTEATLAALPSLLGRMAADGVQAVTLRELLAAGGRV